MFGLDLHTAIIHFPIALVAVGALTEIGYLLLRRDWLKWFGPILLTMALAGSGAAYFSGTSVEDKAEHQGVPEAAIESHESYALGSIGAMALAALLSWATRPRGKALWLPSLAALIAASLTMWTGHLGGELVFVHGAGRVTAAAGQKAGAADTTGAEKEESGEERDEGKEH
jgi:uncharacterized membrane protein